MDKVKGAEMKGKKGKYCRGCSREMSTEPNEDYCYLCRDGMNWIMGKRKVLK